jgi:hypothetical protein
VFGEQAKW